MGLTNVWEDKVRDDVRRPADRPPYRGGQAREWEPARTDDPEDADSRVATALAEHEANKSKNGDDSHNSGSGGRRQVPTTRKCTYSDFLKCQALNFKGTEGVVGLTQWFKMMESVFRISNCTVANQKTLMKMMTDKYCPRGEIKKLEIEIWNLKVKGTDEASDNYLSRKQFDKEIYLEQPIPAAPVAAAPDQPIPPVALATYNE
ncbi:hypothetical protein Tco_0967861 [Tanacetum coccineum]